jgi:hypothetical protein
MNFLSNQRNALGSVLKNSKGFLYGLMLYVACRPELVEAGVLSKGLCKQYRLLVDNELFVVVAVIAAVILIIAWKASPSGSIISKMIGLLAALLIALNIENFLQAVAGTGIGC